MSTSAKRIQALLALPPQMRFEDVQAILEEYGYVLERTQGSHNMFRKAGAPKIDVPTVKGRFVKQRYLKLIAQKLGLEGS